MRNKKVIISGTVLGVLFLLVNAGLMVVKDVKTERTTVVLDGWSYKALGDNELILNSHNLKFKPVGEKQYKDLVKSDNEGVRQTVARMYLPSPELKCTANECNAEGVSISTDKVLNPTKEGPYSKVYKDWEITKGLYAASIKLDNVKNKEVSLSGPNGTTKILGGTTTIVGYAFGTTFPLNTPWITDSNNTHVNTFPDTGYTYASDGKNLPNFVIEAKKGTGQIIPAARDLISSQLTTWSSPTTGCGSVALCAPTALSKEEVTITESSYQQDNGKVCLKGVANGTSTMDANIPDNATLELHAELRDFVATYRGNKNITQMGIWGGTSPSEGTIPNVYTQGSSPTTAGFSGHFKQYTLYSGAGELYGVGGTVYELGVDEDSAQPMSRNALEENLVNCDTLKG